MFMRRQSVAPQLVLPSPTNFPSDGALGSPVLMRRPSQAPSSFPQHDVTITVGPPTLLRRPSQAPQGFPLQTLVHEGNSVAGPPTFIRRPSQALQTVLSPYQPQSHSQPGVSLPSLPELPTLSSAEIGSPTLVSSEYALFLRRQNARNGAMQGGVLSEVVSGDSQLTAPTR